MQLLYHARTAARSQLRLLRLLRQQSAVAILPAAAAETPPSAAAEILPLAVVDALRLLLSNSTTYQKCKDAIIRVFFLFLCLYGNEGKKYMVLQFLW